MTSPKTKLFIVAGPHASGKSKLISLLQAQNHPAINASNTEFLAVKIHCQPKYAAYFKSRGYETEEISQNFAPDASPDTLFRLDDLLWVEIPPTDKLTSLLNDKNVVLKLTGTTLAPINKLIDTLGEENVRVIALDCSNDEAKWNERLKHAVLWDAYEIEKLIHRGKYFVTNEITSRVKYFEIVDNDSSLEEGLDRFVRALTRARVHAEDVDLFYNTKHETLQYLESLNIQDLLEHLMTQLLIVQPEKPKEYLVEYLTQIKNSSQKTSIFSNDDLEAMFQMIDLTGQDKITKEQLRNALRNLAGGASGSDENGKKGGGATEERINGLLSGVGDNVDQETFVRVSKELLEVNFS